MFRAFFFATFLLFQAASSTQAQSWNTAKEAEVVNLLLTRLAPQTPSYAISIGINGNLVLARGFGSAAPGVAATEHTIYHIGSVTKQFTAAAILSLIDDGRKVADQPFGFGYPMKSFFTSVDHWPPELTVGRLLTMSATLPSFTNYPGVALNPTEGAPWREILSKIKGFPSGPGVGPFNYSNTNYFLLGQIVEVTLTNAGESADLHRYVRSRIFTRAAMNETGFINDYPAGPARAQPRLLHPAAFNQPDWPKGAGDIASNVVDMFKWNTALLSGQIISAAGLDAMLTPNTPISANLGYGMGWFVSNSPLVQNYYHTGTISGFNSFNGIVRTAAGLISVTILTNSDDVNGLEQLAGQIAAVAQRP